MKNNTISLVILLISLLITSCARMGSPDGGWYDDDPPRILGSTPADGATGVTAQKITIVFDEYIKLDNPTQNVIVSPPQLEMPEIKAAGKKIVVELKDTLKENTTYTIDFGDAISDNNEGNPMGSYTFTFSTGEQIDTFEVSGYVLDAENLEPVKDISVGLYDDHADSAFHTKPLMRISRTDDTGRFSIKGVAEGQYRIYALQDADGDYRFSQKSEMIAYSHQIITPSCGPDIRQDTIWTDTLHIADIKRVPFTHFYPDDVVLMAFNETLTSRYLVKTERKDEDRISVFFSYGSDSLPLIRGLNFDADSAFIVESNLRRDSITYWLRDTTLIKQDTLLFSMTYMASDSTDQLVMQTDTVEALPKLSYEKRQKLLNKKIEEWTKEQEKLKKRGEPYDSIYPVVTLNPEYSIPQVLAPTSRVWISMPNPLAVADTSKIHLYAKKDSLWYDTPFTFRQSEERMRSYSLTADWTPGTEYSLETDSAAFIDIYGHYSTANKRGLQAADLEKVASIAMKVSGIADSCTVIVQLLDRSDKVLSQKPVDGSGRVLFDFLQPATYYLRAFCDRNGNQLWDTGCYDDDQAPEDVYYYHRGLEAKAKWDITQNWDLTSRQRWRQKPGEITKQKGSKQKKQLRDRNSERARQLGIEYRKE